ncbi:EF-hand domain-containing protein D2 [Galendromus occidentalis]|uniref:EF-hand domain-containing protein D2 n=1 Tax=Galendromus occidentalis TaxID=34638 RepID=A0AAJ6QUR5_9ACAR|nr:EF-hand domain-containing protein D2 [Galendromus occidentalis]
MAKNQPHHELKILQHFNPFEEFDNDEIEKYKQQFDKFDVNGDHVLDFMELKRMMEILGAPQTHVQLKNMIQEIDSDFDGIINFTEFLLIFKKARDGELSSDSGLLTLARMTSIDVSQAGVSGAKDFFEAKAKVLTDSNLARRASNASSVSSVEMKFKDKEKQKVLEKEKDEPKEEIILGEEELEEKKEASDKEDEKPAE